MVATFSTGNVALERATEGSADHRREPEPGAIDAAAHLLEGAQRIIDGGPLGSGG